ncbi:MAG: hypothetical protein NVS3B21_31170 [Acidimicrobiales bacterium]
MTAIADAVAGGALPGRVWMYSNYHCNLACTYCLTESTASSDRRQLSHAQMIDVAVQAKALGFTDLGVTGGEPFMSASMPATLAALGEILPLVVLTNGTLITDQRLDALTPLADLPVAIQISLDRPDPETNDALRGPHNFAMVIDAIPRLVERNIGVRLASTMDPDHPADDEERERLCELHRALGVPDEDHVVRPVVRRGRARTESMGVEAMVGDLPPELTITADGAYWSPFGPTVRDGRLDTDLLITRTTNPLATPAGALLRLVEGRPPGTDAQLGIR